MMKLASVRCRMPISHIEVIPEINEKHSLPIAFGSIKYFLSNGEKYAEMRQLFAI